MSNLDELEDLLRRIEKEKAYELISKDKGITADILITEGINFGIIKEYNLSISYFELAGKIAEDAHIKEEAEKNLAGAYNNRGIAYNEQKQYERAIEDYNTAIALHPNLAMAYNNRGFAYGQQKQYERAIEDFNTAIALHPNYADAYNNRGIAYGQQKQYERAIEDFNTAIALNPNLAMAYHNRGNAYYRLKRYKEAIKDYNTAIELNLNYADVYINRGLAYSELKRYKEAIKDYNTAIALNPNYAVAYNNLGTAHYKLKRYEEAIKDYNTAIALNPNYADAYANRGFTRLQTNEELDNAIEDFKHARALFKGRDKERMLGFIEWAEARKAMNMKSWDGFRERMNEAREIFEQIGDPLSISINAFIQFSYLDEKLDNALNITEPIEALTKIEEALRNLPKVEGLIDPERTIFGARIASFAILREFISSVRGIDENTDLEVVKAKLSELYKRAEEVEKAFESVKFDAGKTTIVDIQRIISSFKQEMDGIKWAAMEILKEYWSRLSHAIKMMNGVSTHEIEIRALEKQIKGLTIVTLEGFKRMSEEHKEILETIYRTENILMQSDTAKYIIEIKAPLISSLSPVSVKIDIPMGTLTEEQIEKKAEEIVRKIKYVKDAVRDRVKVDILEAIKRIPVIGDKLLKRLNLKNRI